MKKKTVQILSLIFSLLIFTSAVYASVNGTLSLTGYASLNGNVDLCITSANILSPRTGETIDYQAGYEATKDRITFSLYLGYPGDTRTVAFYIQNIGSAAAVLGTWQAAVPQIADTGLVVNFPDLAGKIIPPATIAGPYYINVYWDVNYPNVDSGNRNFSATIDYHM